MSFSAIRWAAVTAAECVVLSVASVPLVAQGKLAVSVGGLRVVGPGIGESGSEQRPFNEGTGTTIVLLVKAPKGTGIVDLDNDGSVIDTVSDDKGTNLLEDASFGSFPEVVKDGSAALIEMNISGPAGAGSGASADAVARRTAIRASVAAQATSNGTSAPGGACSRSSASSAATTPARSVSRY